MPTTTPDIDRMLAEAAEATGHDDFGHPSYRDALERLVTSVQESAALTGTGQAVFEGQTRAALANRLRVLAYAARHPEIAAAPVAEPVFIVGLSRTGTTALSHLLARDPANRSLLGWEANDCVPPPRAATYGTDPRFLAARDRESVVDTLNPGFRAIHHDPADLPVECAVVLAQHFTSLGLSTMYTIPAYDEWLLDPATDFGPAYDYHRTVLRVLQSEHPGRWQLKAPLHCYAIGAVAAAYPGARFVVTHRDPAKAVASVCSLVRSLSGTFTELDPAGHAAGIGRRWPGILATMVDRVLDHRDTHGDADFHDIAYADLVGDPIGVVRRLYAWLGRELTPEAEAAMRAHVAARPRDRHGRHTYDLADYGLERGAVDELFARYLARFDVPREAV